MRPVDRGLLAGKDVCSAGKVTRMEKILVTGFEPFGGELTNPSWEVASALPTTIAGHAVVCEQIGRAHV